MGDGSKIQWTDATWNPLRGCSRVSEGCRNCYAETVAKRFSGPGLPYEGLIGQGGQWNGTIRLVPELLDQPLRWRKPRRVFVNSMSDLYHPRVPYDWICRVWAVMNLAHWHTFQILTKRPEQLLDWFQSDPYTRILRFADEIRDRRPDLSRIAISDPNISPPRHIQLGVSCEDQATADARIPPLLQTPAAVRFVSAEPLLGPVNLEHWLDDFPRGSRRVDWVIVGGESGPRARPCDVGWVRSIVAQCRDARTACFVKQLGANAVWRPPYEWADGGGRRLFETTDLKGADPAEWPADLRVREFPAGAPA